MTIQARRYGDALRQVITRLNITQRRLAQEIHVGESTLSDYLSGRRLPPPRTADDLAHRAGTDGQRLRALYEEARSAARRVNSRPVESAAESWADAPALPPELVSFVRAVQRVTSDLPYRLLGGRRQLADVYVRQQVSAMRDEALPEPEADFETTERPSPRVPAAFAAWSPRQPVDEILVRHRHLLVEGPAGLGKSTLGYRLAGRLAGTWLDGDVPPLPSPLLPLVIPARVLAEYENVPLEEGIAAAAAGEYGRFTPAAVLPSSAFTRVLDGAGWFVVIDALDEIPEERGRGRLFAKLAHAMEDPASPLRFLITTRPLTPGETSQLQRADVGFYELAPFDKQALAAFAERWFNPHGAADGGAKATRFLDYVRVAGLIDVLTVPLLAAIAALVHEQDLTRPLPTNRLQLYERYMQDLVDGRSGIDDDRDRFETWDRRALLEKLAVVYTTTERPLLEAAREFVAERLPDGAPAPRDDYLVGICSHGGLVVPAGRDLRFIHQTFAEHLAADAYARTLAADFPTDDAASGDLLRRALQEDADAQRVLLHYLHRRDVSSSLIDRLQSGTAAHQECADVLIAKGAPVPEQNLGRYLTRLAARMAGGGVSDQEIRALAGRIRHPAVLELLRRLAEDEFAEATVRIAAVLVLAGAFVDVRTAAPGWYDAIVAATDTFEVRISAAEARAQLGGDQVDIAASALLDVATDDSASPYTRTHAATGLAELGAAHADRAADLLRAMAEDIQIPAVYRISAAQVVAELSDENRPSGIAALGRLLADSESFGVRRSAAEAIARLSGGQENAGVETLRKLTDDQSLTSTDRLQAMVTLAIFDPRGRAEVVDRVRRHLREPQRPLIRSDLAFDLRLLGPQYASAVAECLEMIVHDPSAYPPEANRCADLLEQLGASFRERAVAARTIIAGRSFYPTALRIRSIVAAAMLDARCESAAISLLSSLATEPAGQPWIRRRAAQELVKFGDAPARWVAETFEALLTDPLATMEEQLAAVQVVADTAPRTRPVAVALLDHLSASLPDAKDRTEAAEALLRLDGRYRDPAVEVFADVATDPAATTDARRDAVSAITRLGPGYADRAAVLLERLTHDPWMVGERAYCLDELARLSVAHQRLSASLVLETWSTGDELLPSWVIRQASVWAPDRTTSIEKLVVDLMENPGADISDRIDMAALIVEDERFPFGRRNSEAASRMLTALAEARHLGVRHRLAAARLLGSRTRGLRDVVSAIVGDAGLPAQDRYAAAECLAELWPSEGAELEVVTTGPMPWPARVAAMTYAANVRPWTVAAQLSDVARDALAAPFAARLDVAATARTLRYGHLREIVDLLISVASDVRAEVTWRVNACAELAELGEDARTQAATFLVLLAGSAGIAVEHRCHAAAKAIELGPPHSDGVAAAIERIGESPAAPFERCLAAEQLARLGQRHRQRASEILLELLRDRDASIVDSVTALRLLGRWQGPHRSASPEIMLRTALTELPTSSWTYRWAVEELICLGPEGRQHAAAALTVLAGEQGAPDSTRLWAAALIPQCGWHYTDAFYRFLIEIAAASKSEWWARLHCCELLEAAGAARRATAGRLLGEMMADSDAVPRDRAAAARLHARFGRPECRSAATVIEDLARAPDPDSSVLEALATLSPSRQPVLRDRLSAIAHDRSQSLENRVRAAVSLGEIDYPSRPAVADTLLGLVAGGGHELPLVFAGRALRSYGEEHQEAVREAMRALAAMPGTGQYTAALAAAVAGPKRTAHKREAAERLDTVIADPSTPSWQRGVAVEELNRLGFLFPGNLP